MEKIDDYSISDNGNRNKILATVTHAIDIYLNSYSDRIIFFTGSTKERTRLYRMAISQNFEYLSSKFEIHCQAENGIFPFQKDMEIIGF